MMVSKNNIRKIKNNTFAIEAAPAAIPVKPNTAAIIAITKKITAYLSITKFLVKHYNRKCVPNFSDVLPGQITTRLP